MSRELVSCMRQIDSPPTGSISLFEKERCETSNHVAQSKPSHERRKLAYTRQRREIRYRFEQTALGGRVGIVTTDPAALAAVHAFLRYQIQDHQTGNPTSPSQR